MRPALIAVVQLASIAIVAIVAVVAVEDTSLLLPAIGQQSVISQFCERVRIHRAGASLTKDRFIRRIGQVFISPTQGTRKAPVAHAQLAIGLLVFSASRPRAQPSVTPSSNSGK